MGQSASPVRNVLVLFLSFLGLAAVSNAGQRGVAPALAVPVDPAAAIIDAFRSHAVVALGDGSHGNEQSHAFRLALIRDPRFAATVNDVVVEWGNARYQDVLDRFVHGEEVSDTSLRQVWRNTTTPTTLLDLPIREDFFREVRSVNGSLPRERKIRVLLGDPPIDWDQVRSPDNYAKWLELRDRYPAELIQREVLAKGRRALVIYGDMHFQRKNLGTNYVMSDPIAQTIVSLIENAGATKVFTIWTNTAVDLATLQSDVASWHAPSLAVIPGTVLGAVDFTAYYPLQMPRVAIRDGKPDLSAPVPRDQWRSLRMEDQVDAVLYLGPPSMMTTARLSPTICADTDYVQTLLARMPLAGLPQNEIEQLKRFCAARTPR